MNLNRQNVVVGRKYTAIMYSQSRTLQIFNAVVLVALLQLHAVCGLYGGDMMLTPEQQATLEAMANLNNPQAPQNAVLSNMRSLWPDAVVPFIIDNSLGTRARNAIQAAIDDYKTYSCVNFVARTTERDYVRFFRGNGCFSFIGRLTGPQDISIGQGCEFKGIVIHEMFHALGRFHEQSRPDRDMFVTINRANIQSGMESNFDITSPSFVTTQGVPYDLGSIMHYGAFDFSRNGQPTIVPVDSTVPLSALGQRDGFSNSDLDHVNLLYCGAGLGGTWSAWGQWSGCSRTCNGGTRSRTRTCQGGTDCQGSNIDTQSCNTNPCPVPATWGTWSNWGDCTATCGGGRQQRQRICVGGNTCVGNNAEFRDCNTQSCPQPPTWGPWGSWSACGATCQGGQRQRVRRCQNGLNCPGEGIQIEFCNSNIPCIAQPNPDNGEWSQWSQCTKSCGGGTRFRARMCGGPNCDFEQQNCNTQPCAPEPNLRGLVHVGCYLIGRFAGNLGLLEGRTADLMDDPLTRTEPIRKCGVGAQQFGYRYFAISTGYCITGSNRRADYRRTSSDICSNGVGGVINGNFAMDVYLIQDPTAFLNSVAEITAPTTPAAPSSMITDQSIGSVGEGELVVDNGAPDISTSFTLLLTLAFITILTILLQ